jgi:hypothetical protein
MPDGPEQEARDEIFLSQLGGELKGAFPSRWTCPQVQPWLYGYDAFKEVQDAVQKSPFPETKDEPTCVSSKRSSQLIWRLSSWVKTRLHYKSL